MEYQIDLWQTVLMAEKRLDLGGTGETVRTNVKRLRGGMQYKELAERLAELGNPIPPLGLRRIEGGERRVTVDDLCALAVAFNVSPLTLLLPEDGLRVAASRLTGVPSREVSHNTQWLWGLGEEPLELPDFGVGPQAERDKAVFRSKARPQIDERIAAVAAWQSEGVSPEEHEAAITKQFETIIRTQGFAQRHGDD